MSLVLHSLDLIRQGSGKAGGVQWNGSVEWSGVE